MGEIKKMKAEIVKDRKGGVRFPGIALLAALIFALLYYYFALPAINLHNPSFYTFFFLTALVYCVVDIFSTGIGKSDAKDFWPALKQNCLPALVVCAVMLGILIVGGLLGSVIFRAPAYTELMQVETGDFRQDVEEVSYDRIPMLDKDSAERLGDRKLGELSDMVSQFEVNDDYSQINYQDRPVRVATLRYGDFFKWLNNFRSGLPAYIVIDMTTQNAEVVRLSSGMRYGYADKFGRYLPRHLRLHYPTYMFDTCNFEIDEDGHPYWVCPRAVRTIGLFGGRDICGAVLVDAVTGESSYYALEDIPTWVDRVFSAELLIEQYDYHGMYGGGFINSLFGQKGVTVTTEGYNYIALDDDVWVYTGITSVGGDESNIGFILANQRTKRTAYYPCAGAEEYSARSSAEGVVQHLSYTATFPLLLNISGEPTYFISLKDDAELVKMYAMVNVRQYNIVATGTTVAECESSYLKLLGQNGVATGAQDAGAVEGVLAEVRSAVIDGNTRYYLRLDGEDVWYTISAAECERAVILSAGDSVRIVPSSGTGDIRAALRVE